MYVDDLDMEYEEIGVPDYIIIIVPTYPTHQNRYIDSFTRMI